MSQFDHIPEVRLRAIEVTGPDAVAFMQSQLTVDVAAIGDSRLQPAAWCRPDGRVDAVLLVAVDGATVWLVLPEALVAPTLKRARMFSIGRKVALEPDVPARPAMPGSSGPRVFGLALDPERALQLDEPGATEESRPDRLSNEWLLADIACAMPWVLPETSGAYLPQMLGLESLGGISYKKGCFPGQEVIARVHYRGRVTRRTSRFRLTAGSAPKPGTGFDLAGKPAQVLYAAPDPENPGFSIGLAVIAAEAGEDEEVRLGSATGALLR